MIVNYHVLGITALFILLDILSGVTQAVKNKTLSSKIMRQGIYHKLGYMLIMALAALAEYSVLYMDLGFQTPLLVPSCVLICLTETVSIVENIELINPELKGTGIFYWLKQNKGGADADEK